MRGLNVNGRIREALRDIGLTEYEALAYIALVSLGEMTAIRVSEATSIPYSKIYSVLEGLKKRGWIGVKERRPKTYFPRSPIDALRSEKMKMENKFQIYEKMVLEELQPLFEQERIKERPEIWIVRGNKNIISNIIKVVKSTRNRLMMAIPAMSLEMHQNVLPLLRETQGVKIQLLMTEELFRVMGKNLLVLGEVRTRDEMFGGGLVADGRECMIFLDEEHGHLAIWSDDIGLTTIAKVYFEHLWESAKPTTHEPIKTN